MSAESRESGAQLTQRALGAQAESLAPRSSGRSVPPNVEHRTVDLNTPQGTARCYVVEERVEEGSERVGTLLLGHGAGKGTNTPDLHGLLTLADDGWRVILVDQPWVVAGRRLATRPPTLDDAWLAVAEQLRERGELGGVLVAGGRSAGARVACRTAAALHVDGVLALAFPLMPPGRKDAPEKWRTAEAQAVLDAGIPLIVVQGEKDAFGGPSEVAAAVPGARVLGVAGAHGFAKQPDDVVAAARAAVADLLSSRKRPAS